MLWLHLLNYLSSEHLSATYVSHPNNLTSSNSKEIYLTIQQAATGYASLNGGTTGGAGGTTTTVSSYAALATAVAGDDKKVIFVSGTITQTADQIRPGNNTSIIGKNSSAKLVNFGMFAPPSPRLGGFG